MPPDVRKLILKDSYRKTNIIILLRVIKDVIVCSFNNNYAVYLLCHNTRVRSKNILPIMDT